MFLSTQTDILTNRLGEEKAIEMLAKAGYDAIDLSCFEMVRTDIISPKNTSEYKSYAQKLKKIADDNGVYFNQAHAPFPSSILDNDEFNKNITEKIIRSMEFCSLLGIRNIVVHPKQHLTYREGNNAQILKDINVEFYNSLIPYCKEFNIHVCCENMWQYDENREIRHSVCSRAEEFKEYLDLIDSPWIVACLDIGHARLMDADIPEFIHTLGDKLKALHVHDAGYNVDFHRLPYTIGTTKWAPILEALADINYDGELTFEADHTLLYMPDDMLLPTAEFMAKVGKSMIRQFDEFKNK